jgi:phage protein, HK97 gp10 family
VAKKKGFHVVVEGIDDLYAACRKLKGDARNEALNAVRASARAVKSEMLKRVPVNTGHLKSVITSRSDKHNIIADVGPRSGNKAHYGYWQEFGTSKMEHSLSHVPPRIRRGRNSLSDCVRRIKKALPK